VIPPAVTEHLAKGSTLRSTLEFVARTYGDDRVREIRERLAPDARSRIDTPLPTDELPYALLVEVWRAADAVLRPVDAGWAERAGAFSIESLGVQMYRGILLKATPTEFLTQRVSLYRLFYQPGNMEVVAQGTGHAVLRLVGFEPVDPLFCRRQTGGLLRSVELAGGEAATVTHSRCSLEGDAFCEWELGWK
jgi:hypothetical protein